MEETKQEALEVDMADEVIDNKPATHVAASDTCPATALKAKSATTVVKLVTCLVNAPKKLRPSVLATSARCLATNRLNAPAKFSK